jgi:hypothetical protein
MNWLRRYERFWSGSLARLAAYAEGKEPKCGRTVDNQPHPRAPDQGAAVDRL